MTNLLITDRHLERLPLFPLPKTVFFPNTVLPLHVFEPRYLALTQDCIRRRWPLAVVLIAKGHEADQLDDPPLESVAGIGHIIAHTEGEIDDAFYVLVSGSVLVRKGTKSIAILRRGDCFGEMGYISKTRRTATILATSPVDIMKINATLIEQLTKDTQLRFHRVVLRTRVERLTRASDALSDDSAAPNSR